MSKAVSPNHREAITAISTITGQDEYLTSANGVLNVSGGGGGGGGTSSSFGAPFPTTGTAAGAIDSGGNMAGLNLDGSGNLLVSGSFTPALLQDVNLTEVSGSPISIGQQTSADSLPVTLDTTQNGYLGDIDIATTNTDTTIQNVYATPSASTTGALTIQGITGMTPVIIDGSGTVQPISGTVGTTSAVVNVGQQTVDTTPVQLNAASTTPTNGIIVRALAANGANIYVGDSGVTTSTGYELAAGESVSFTCDLSTLYIVSVASTTDGVCYNVE